MTVTVLPVRGVPEVVPGDDLAGLLVAALEAPAAPTLADGDILVVTSKVVSKSEGRVVEGCDRDAVIDQETTRVVSKWSGPGGRTVIAETRHGFVLAAAGVDASNTPNGSLVLLPEDPDVSAARLRRSLADRLGVTCAVVVSDTMGRPWRQGQTDVAIGAAGLVVLIDHRGTLDPHGNELSATWRAVADEIAATADLVAGKTASVPAVIVRGLADLVLPRDADGPGARALVRPAAQDRFRMGTPEAMRQAVLQRRTVREFTDEPVPWQALERGIAAAMTAPAPHHTTPWRFVVVDGNDARRRLSEAMRAAWRDDLRADGRSDAEILGLTARSSPLDSAPVLMVACLVTDGARAYPEPRRRAAEDVLFWLSMGAGVENMLVALAAEGLGTVWLSAPVFCPDAVRGVLGIDDTWRPAGAIAVGYPARAPDGRRPRSLDQVIRVVR